MMRVAVTWATLVTMGLTAGTLCAEEAEWVMVVPDRVAPPAKTAAPPRRKVDPGRAAAMIRAGLRAHDEAIGHALPGAQTIAKALADAVRPHVPNVGRAWFEARLTSDGELVALRVVSYDRSDGPLFGWRHAAADAKRALQPWTFRIPSTYRDGAIVRIRIDSNLELPSGSGRTHRPGPAAPLPLERPRWPWDPMRAPEEQLLPALRALPIETGGFMGTVHVDFSTCIPTRTQTCPPGAGDFDLSDLGAHAQRVVHTHVEIVPLNPSPGGPRRATLAPRRVQPLSAAAGAVLVPGHAAEHRASAASREMTRTVSVRR